MRTVEWKLEVALLSGNNISLGKVDQICQLVTGTDFRQCVNESNFVGLTDYTSVDKICQLC